MSHDRDRSDIEGELIMPKSAAAILAAAPALAILAIKILLVLFVADGTDAGLPFQTNYQRIAEAWTWPTVVAAMAMISTVPLAAYVLLVRREDAEDTGSS
jgi:hypothetical protein